MSVILRYIYENMVISPYYSKSEPYFSVQLCSELLGGLKSMK